MEMKRLHCLFFCLSPLLTFEPLCQYLSGLLTVYRAQRCEVLSSFVFFLPYLTLKWQHLLLEIVRTAKLFSGFFFFFGDLQRGIEVIWGLIPCVSLWRLLAINQLALDASSWVRFKILVKKKKIKQQTMCTQYIQTTRMQLPLAAFSSCNLSLNWGFLRFFHIYRVCHSAGL